MTLQPSDKHRRSDPRLFRFWVLVVGICAIASGSIRSTQAFQGEDDDSRDWMIREFASRLHSGGPSSRRRALQELSRYGADATPHLLEGLDDRAFEVRDTARRIFAEAGSWAEAPLREALKESNPRRRCGAVYGLASRAVKDPSFLSAIRSLEEDGVERVRVAVAFALVLADRDPVGNSRRILSDALSSEDRESRLDALWNLGRLKASATVPTGEVEANLQHPDVEIRIAAACLLAKVGEGRVAQLETLLNFLRTADESHSYSAIIALREIGPETLELIAPLLRDSKPEVRQRAARALARQGTGALPYFIKALEENFDRLAAIEGLFMLQERAAPAVPALIATLGDEDPEVRSMACYILAHIGPRGRDALPRIEELFLDPDADDVDCRSWANNLVEFGTDAIPVLLRVGKKGNSQASRAAAEALVSMGSQAHADLRKLAEDKAASAEAREVAERALGIRPTTGRGRRTTASGTQGGNRNRSRSGGKSGTASGREDSTGSIGISEDLEVLIEQDAVEALRLAVKKVHVQLFKAAAVALGQRDKFPRHGVNILSAALFERPLVPTAKFYLLREGSRVIPNMMKALEKGNDTSKQAAYEILVALGKPSVAPLAGVLRHKDPRLRLRAARGLGEIGRPAAKALPALNRAKRDRVSSVRDAVERSIETIEMSLEKKGKE